MQEVENILNGNLLAEDFENQIVVIEDRLFAIRALAKKHNVNVASLSIFLQESVNKLALLKQDVCDEENLVLQNQLLFDEYKSSCQNLSNKRKEFAAKLEQKINAELAELISPSSSFKVSISHYDFENGQSSGIDQVRFMVSTNVGMDHMPIDQVASGGELSRIMLAIKSVMLNATAKPIIIFDEIDTGVGGSVAEIIGDKLKALSMVSQIISITHQAQIASKGDQHIFVFKTQDESQTFCRVKILEVEEKIQELARMISGKNITEKTRDVAREMVSK
jgi:DNA repair protein RecN (Recombination protein N)